MLSNREMVSLDPTTLPQSTYTILEAHNRPPIMFNAFKHHLNSMVATLATWIQQGEGSLRFLQDELKKIKGLIDIYTGDLPPASIQQQILFCLNSRGCLEESAYINFIARSGTQGLKGGYRLLRLKDTSTFVLRVGEIKGYHVHLHPARFSNHTLRARANTIATTLTSMLLGYCRGCAPVNFTLVCEARERLGLSPVPTIPTATLQLEKVLQPCLLRHL